MAEQTLQDVDFDLHGLVGVRLCDASATDVAAVRRQLGPVQRRLDRPPDVTVRFVDRLPSRSPLRYLGPDEAGFTDDAFLVLRSKHKAKARVEVPLADVGRPCELVCERGLPAVPLLIPILNLTALVNGALPLHAAAFERNGVGAVATGWSKGGKTESLLAFAGHGGRYVADEWAYIEGDGARVHGVPEPLRIWDWHLPEVPAVAGQLTLGNRARLGVLRGAAAGHERTPAWARGTGVGRLGDRAAHALQRQRHVDLAPERLFGADLGSLTTSFDLLLFVTSTDGPETTIEPMDPAEVAGRMVASLQFERLGLLGFYRMFQFAFPGEVNPSIEGAEELERARLLEVFAGKRTYRVAHPYPVRLAELRDVMGPCFDGGTA